jgi:GTP-binding protein EngB required for normal cell division
LKQQSELLRRDNVVIAMDLKQYEQAKFAMAELIRSAQALDTKDQDLLSASRDLLTRLADDRFNLMLVGRFSRGKSTLINAILGAAHLPTGILPLTSVITTVRYGSRTQVVLNFNDRQLRQEIPLARLAEYVTQQSNPGNVKNVAYAEIELPVELLRRGVFFVDSPGLGSAIAENTQTTERFFPEADAFVLITSYDSPLSDEENRALYRIRQTDKTLFVIVNKQDTVDEDERRQVLDYVKSQMDQFSLKKTPQVFSVSARQALEAKQSQQADRIASSGILQFQEELLRFLIEERAEAFLSNMYERIKDFLLERRNLEKQTERRPIWEEFLERLQNLHESEAELFSRQDRHYTTQGSSAQIPLDLEKRSGCRICGEVLDAVFHFLSKHQYDLVIDRDAQREHASRGGFCSLHTWQYENISSPYGVCTAYPELAHRMATELQSVAEAGEGPAWSARGITQFGASQDTCKVCQVRLEAEGKTVKEAVSTLRRSEASPNGRQPACCLLHLAMIVGQLGKGRAAESLLNAHAQFFERIAEDAQRYALRHDALRRHLTSEEERRASQLMLLMLAGHRSLCAPWNVQSLF